MFGIAIIASLLLLVLGNQIQVMAGKYVPVVGRIIGKIIGARTALMFGGLFLVFLILYKMLPNRKATLKSQVPGAVLIAAGWSLFSYFFSIYFDMFPGFSNMYGSLTALIMVMLWLYICLSILFYGAYLNQLLAGVWTLLPRRKKEKAPARPETEPDAPQGGPS